MAEEYDDEYYDDEPYDEEDDDSLSGALTEQMGSAPWYVSSVAIHVLIFLIALILFPPAKRDAQPRRLVIQPDIVEPEPEEEEEPEENEIEETKVIDPELPPIEAPVVTTTDVEITDHYETADEMDDNSAKGDPDMIADFDSEDKGTPALMGVGHSGGSGGGGRFGFRRGGGRRKALARGGGGGTGNALDWALRWLAEHQEEDGSWDNSKYGGGGHNVGDNNNVASTALALLAFLGAGNSSRFGKYKDNVQRATYWLLQQMKPSGEVGFHRYQSAIGAMALAEAYGMGDKGIRAEAQRAIDWACQSMCPTGGWDYRPNSPRTDMSVTGWWVMALKSAKVAGLTVPSEVFEKALALTRASIDVKDGGYGAFTRYAGNAQTPQEFHNNVGGHGSGDRRTAIALTCLQFLGVQRDDPQVQACANELTKNGPPSPDHFDFYRWYYGALGQFQMGIQSEHWQKWNPGMKNSLLSTQVKVGTFKENKGSWNPEGDTYGSAWSRVGQTAIGALMLEVYFRYYEVAGKKKH